MSTTPSAVNSSSSKNALYGIQWSLEVQTPQGGGSQSVLKVTGGTFLAETIRITFDVYTPCIQSAYWYADINIYNFNSDTALTLINGASNIAPGMTVILKAGFANGNYDVIWQGPVFQPTFVRENVTDYKLSLHCILGLAQASNGQVLSGAYAAGQNQAEIITQMMQSIGLQVNPFGTKTQVALTAKKLPRGVTVFGSPDEYMDDIAEDNNMVWFLQQRGLAGSSGVSIGILDDGINATPQSGYVYTPSSGLLDTPIQTQAGVDFSILLDPRIKAQFPLMTVQIQQVIIQQLQRSPNSPQVTPLSTTGTYVVGAVRHRGDSRGNVWQTDITGYTLIGDVLALLANNANVN